MEDSKYYISMVYPEYAYKKVYTNEFTYHNVKTLHGEVMAMTDIKTEFLTRVGALTAASLLFELYPDVKQVELYRGIVHARTFNRGELND